MIQKRIFSYLCFMLLCLSSAGAVTPASDKDARASNNEERRFKEGVDSFEAGRYDDAIEAYRQVILLNPRHSAAYYNLGMAFSSKGQYSQAVEAYNHAIHIRPDYGEAYNNLGHAYSLLKKYDNAIDAFRQAIKHMPDNIEAYCGLGRAFFNSGKDEKAVHTFEQAIRMKPGDPYIYFNLGLLYFPGGPFSEAVDAFTQAIRLDPRYAESYYYRAYEYLCMGRGDSAATDAETYISLKGWRAEHSQYMAIVAYFGHLQAQQQADARRIIDEATRKCDSSAWPYPVIEYLGQNISARRLYSLASSESNKVEARTYIGTRLSLLGNHKYALSHLQWVKEHSRWGTLDRTLAESEIHRIELASVVSRK